MLLTTLFTSALLAQSTLARSVVVEKRSSPPALWKRSNSVLDTSSIIPLRIGLVQQNLHKVNDELMKVSSPDSKHYGKHWKPQEIKDFFLPSSTSVKAVMDWLNDSGVDNTNAKLSESGTWLTLDVTVEEAESLLSARYDLYEKDHNDEKHQRIACNSYSVPQSVRDHIDIITPTLHFDVPHNIGKKSKSNKRNAARSAYPGSLTASNSGNGPKLSPLGFQNAYAQVADAGLLSNCSNITTLACLASLYNYSNYTQTQVAKNSYAVVEYTPNSYAPQDLDLFFSTYLPEAVGERPTTYMIDGGFITPEPTSFQVNGESDLDLEYAMGIMYPLVPTLYQMGADASLSNFLEAVDASFCSEKYSSEDGVYGLATPVGCGVAPLVSVISTSYAYDEVDLTPAYEIRQCNEYAKLGMMGTTFLFSSGDTGVAGSGGCLDASGQPPAETTTANSNIGFSPSFPGSCPYITSVGATQLKPGALSTDSSPEEACQTVIYSGGGFSNVFASPDYQKPALANYFEKYLPPYNSSQYNTSQTSRGIPDLSANGANYAVAYSGMLGLVYGTSASSPVVGAIISLINDARLAAGKGTVGFINPAIYTDAFAEGFNDITQGGNQGCGTDGFEAVPGWDPNTGLGTPNFEKLKDLFVALP